MSTGLGLAELALKATVLLASGAVVAALARRRPAEERHLVWAAALLGLLLLPVVPGVGPVFELPMPEPPTRVIAAASDPGERTKQEPGVRIPAPAVAAPAAADGAVPAGWARDRTALLVAGYAAVTLALAGWLLLGLLRIATSLRKLPGVDDPSTLALLEQAARRNGVRRAVRLKSSATDVSPLAWGFIRPVIVLPRGFAALPEAERRNALEHELAHVARWDFLTASLGWICCALYWLHPLAWLAWRRMVQESEMACDDRVLLGGNCRCTYARQLLDIARTIHGAQARHPAVAGMAGASPVSRRIAAILDTGTRRKAMSRLKLVLLITAAAAFVIPIGALTAQPAPGAADSANAGVADAEHLESRLRNEVASGLAPEAAGVLADWLVHAGYDAACPFCAEALATERSPSGPDDLLPIVLDAFGRVEQRARAGGNGNLLVRLAEICKASATETASERGTYYLLEGFRIGGLSGPSLLAGVEYLSDLGWYDEARKLAQKLHDDPHSGLYRSPEAEHWIWRLDRKIARTKFIAGRLIAPQADIEVEGDVAPLYRRAPVYPPTALAAHKEGEVLLEFTLSETGRPEDIRVVSSTDSAFERPSISAVSDWLYAPHLVAGVPVDRPGVELVMRFRLVE